MRWLCKVALFAPGVFLLVAGGNAALGETTVGAVQVAAMLAAVAVGCVGGSFPWRWLSTALAALWTVFTFVWPAFGLFLPLVVFDLLEKRLWPLLALAPLCAVANRAAYGAGALFYILFGSCLAVLVWVLQDRAQRLRAENRAVRDAAVAANLALEARNRELAAAREAGAHMATLSERGRIAREIHDSVGHMLARAMMQTGALMATNKDGAAGEALAALRGTLDSAMNSVRASVHDLRDEALDLQVTLDACLRDFPGFEYNLNYDMGEGAPREVKACFAAVVREALANAAKHSNATRIRISLQEHPAFYQLSFVDNGAPGRAQDGGAGMGLDNMRQRTEALGGRMEVWRDKGFGIHITIPTKGDGADGDTYHPG